MDRDSVKEFLREVIGPNVELKDQGGWVSTHCPLARWTHERGTDRNMSFGIKVEDDKDSLFNCLTCKAKGPLTRLLTRLERYTGEDYRDLKEELNEVEVLGGKIPEWDKRGTGRGRSVQLGEPVSLDLLEVYEPAEGHPYLCKRGVSDDSARLLGLQVDPADSHGDERILFPVRSADGKFYGYTGRAVDPKATPRIRDYFGLPKRLLLLGAERINPKQDSFIVLVEGLFDFAKAYQYGYPALAVMHSGITKEQADILKQLSLPVYVMFDNDAAGRQGAEVVKEELYRHVPLMKVRYPDGVKDPGELTSNEMRKMIEEARLL